MAEIVFDEDDFEGETCWRTRSPRRDAVRGGSEGRTDDEAPSDWTTGAGTGGEGDVRLLDVDGIAGPAARLRVTTEGVELTFLAERRAGFLAWLTDDAAGHVYRLMRKHERRADVGDDRVLACRRKERGQVRSALGRRVRRQTRAPRGDACSRPRYALA